MEFAEESASVLQCVDGGEGRLVAKQMAAVTVLPCKCQAGPSMQHHNFEMASAKLRLWPNTLCPPALGRSRCLTSPLARTVGYTAVSWNFSKGREMEWIACAFTSGRKTFPDYGKTCHSHLIAQDFPKPDKHRVDPAWNHTFRPLQMQNLVAATEAQLLPHTMAFL